MGRIIERDRSIIPACDIPPEVFEDLLKATGDLEGIGGYKLGFKLGLKCLAEMVRTARDNTDKPIIYDHQKGATDIPDMGPKFMDEMLEAGVNAVILFPQAGPVTEYEWILAAQKAGLGVIVGGEMTHPRFLQGDYSSGKGKDYTEIFRKLGLGRDLTGFIRPDAPKDIYELAARMVVTDFVVPGTKPASIRKYRALIEEDVGVPEPAFYSPGLVAQGGEISEGARAAGKRFHGIVGRGLYWDSEGKRYLCREEIRDNAWKLTSQL